MTYLERDYHKAVAFRENSAAIRASCPKSAAAHSALAEMHWYEAARVEAVRETIALAFGD